MARVAFILPDLRGGGAERVALTLVSDMIEHGHEVDLVLLGGGGELQALVPEKVRLFEFCTIRFRNALLPLIRYFRERRPDATHAFMWPVTILAILAHRISRGGGRLVVSDHTTVSRHYADAGRLRLMLLKWTIRTFYPFADARVAVSWQAAADLARLSGLNAADFEVIYNPIAPANPGREPAPDWGGPGVRLLTVGSLKREKNHLLLLDAVALLARRHDVRVAIVGDGPMKSDIQARAEALGIASQLELPGFLLDPAPYYESADLFVLTSDYEGYPLVLVEALSAGLNVVSTDCESGPREILDDGRFGRLVPVGDPGALADAIADAIEHPIDADLLTARARGLSEGSLERYRTLMLGVS
jgi:glycosyltransferase involved in cell wall biosynthesis